LLSAEFDRYRRAELTIKILSGSMVAKTASIKYFGCGCRLEIQTDVSGKGELVRFIVALTPEQFNANPPLSWVGKQLAQATQWPSRKNSGCQ
jgi:hypothetical protein